MPESWIVVNLFLLLSKGWMCSCHCVTLQCAIICPLYTIHSFLYQKSQVNLQRYRSINTCNYTFGHSVLKQDHQGTLDTDMSTAALPAPGRRCWEREVPRGEWSKGGGWWWWSSVSGEGSHQLRTEVYRFIMYISLLPMDIKLQQRPEIFPKKTNTCNVAGLVFNKGDFPLRTGRYFLYSKSFRQTLDSSPGYIFRLALFYWDNSVRFRHFWIYASVHLCILPYSDTLFALL